MSDLYWLTDEQMARLRPYFPKSHGKPRVDDRRVLSGIVFVNPNGLGTVKLTKIWFVDFLEGGARRYPAPAHREQGWAKGST